MSVLDDFFGDSAKEQKECLHCGGTDGQLIVAVSDNHGPTHWAHAACRQANTPKAVSPRCSSGDEMEDQ